MYVPNAKKPSGTCSTGNNAYRTTCSFECDRGHERNGSETITCQLNEQWYPDPPSCDGIEEIVD